MLDAPQSQQKICPLLAEGLLEALPTHVACADPKGLHSSLCMQAGLILIFLGLAERHAADNCGAYLRVVVYVS
jgi:hypothetical protein